MIPILVLKTENKVIYNQSNLNCKTFFEELNILGSGLFPQFKTQISRALGTISLLGVLTVLHVGVDKLFS